jgi:hypothetical protein
MSTPSFPDAASAARFALVSKWKEIANEYHTLDGEIGERTSWIAQAQARQAELAAAAQKCLEAAQVFGFDLQEAWVESGGEPAQTLPAAPAAQSPPIKIKDFCLAEAFSAYPGPVQAAELRAKLSAQGIEVHEKTVGMSLYRFLREGLIRRDGRNWYFVPEDERKPKPTLDHLEITMADEPIEEAI